MSLSVGYHHDRANERAHPSRVILLNMDRRTRRRPTAIDLYSGAGGLTLGLRWAGFRIIGAIENEPLAVKTYRLHHPATVMWEKDIRSVTVAAVKRRLRLRVGQLDLLAGCPPCQGFSSIRTRNGGSVVRDKSEKDLLFEFIRFVRGLRPRAVMMENVPRLAADKRIHQFSASLRKLGYHTRYIVLNAANFGVPQRRRRLIFMATRHKAVPLPGGNKAHLVTLRKAIGRLPRPGNTGDPMHDMRESRTQRVARLIRKIPRNGGGRLSLRKNQQLACHRRTNGFKDVYGRMSWDTVAPTITCGFVNPSKGRFLHPVQNRAITLREGALIQTFPRYYMFALDRGKFPAAGLIGNALPPKFIKKVAAPLARQLRT